jgi:hypothetical protein
MRREQAFTDGHYDQWLDFGTRPVCAHLLTTALILDSRKYDPASETTSATALRTMTVS